LSLDPPELHQPEYQRAEETVAGRVACLEAELRTLNQAQATSQLQMETLRTELKETICLYLDQALKLERVEQCLAVRDAKLEAITRSTLWRLATTIRSVGRVVHNFSKQKIRLLARCGHAARQFITRGSRP
jgi:hypothetical protein